MTHDSDSPWMTEEIKKLKLAMNKAYKPYCALVNTRFFLKKLTCWINLTDLLQIQAKLLI